MAQSALLGVGSDSGLPGETISISVGFTPGSTPVSTLQFDLIFSSSLSYVSTSTGVAASAAGKNATGNAISGGVRILVFGLNQNAIGLGALANVQLRISPSAPVGLIPITLTGIVASDPLANPVPISWNAGSVSVVAPSDTTVPSITITSPTANSTYSTNSGILNLSGTASDNVAVTQVTWANSRGGSGTASGTTLWNASNISLLSGSNIITVTAWDAAGNIGTDSLTVAYTSSDATPPVISDVSSSNITSTSATITWNTNEAADAQVDYGTNISYGNTTALNTSMVLFHNQTISGLSPGTLYHYRVRSRDGAGNLATSGNYTFTTKIGGAAITLAVPRFTAGEGQPLLEEETMIGLALLNMDSEPAALTFSAIRNGGELITGPNITNPRELSQPLNAASQLPIIDGTIFGDGFYRADPTGWIKLESTASNIGGFFLIFDTEHNIMDGAKFAADPLTDFVFTEIESAGYNRINIVNNNSESADVTFELINSSGFPRSSLSRSIPANGAFEADLFDDLFIGFEPRASEYVRVHASAGVQPFQLMQRAVGDIWTLTGQDLTAGGKRLYAPQYVLGDIYNTSLSVLNLDSNPGMMQLRFFDEYGNQLGATRRLAIPANGKLHIDNPEFFWMIGDSGIMTQGYVEIISENGERLAGSVVFFDSKKQSFSSALPLVDGLHDSVLFGHVASNDFYFTGIAILNPNAVDAVAMLELYSANGTLNDVRSVEIPSGHRVSWLLTKYFASLEGKNQISGYVKLRSDQPLAAFSLFGTTSMSVLSAIPPQGIQ